MLTHPTLDQLRALRLDGMADAFVEFEAQEEARNLTHAATRLIGALRVVRGSLLLTTGTGSRRT